MPKITKPKTYADYKNAKPKEKPYKLCDGGGLVLSVRPSGQKIWYYHYSFGKSRHTHKLGYFETMNLKEARNIRDELKGDILKGVSPKERVIAEQTILTFQKVTDEWLSRQQWVDGHLKRVSNFFIRHVYPSIGKKVPYEINSHDIKSIISALEKKKKYGVANELVQRCSAVFRYARRNYDLNNNPADGMAEDIPKPKRVNRPHLSEEQIPEFLKKLEDYKGREFIKLGLNILILNFVRPSELRCAVWSEFNLNKAEWYIPASRMKMRKDHFVPLSRQSVILLKKLKSITRNSELLFPSIHSADKPISDVTFLKALKIMGYVGDKKIVPHGFRHTASTILHNHGFNSEYIERQLSHLDKNKIRGVYNKAEYETQRREMMQWYSDYLDKLRNDRHIK